MAATTTAATSRMRTTVEPLIVCFPREHHTFGSTRRAMPTRRFPPPCIKENTMKRAVCTFLAAMLICGATHEISHAAPQYRHSHHYIVIPLTRDYGWWPQGQYRWFPFGLARWGYWCEPASYHRLSCGVGGREHRRCSQGDHDRDSKPHSYVPH